MNDETYDALFRVYKGQYKLPGRRKATSFQKKLQNLRPKFKIDEINHPNRLLFILDKSDEVTRRLFGKSSLPVAKESEIPQIFKWVHDREHEDGEVNAAQPGLTGHNRGRDKCWDELQRTWYTGKLGDNKLNRENLQKYLNSCPVCAEFKAFRNIAPIQPIVYECPMERVQIDLKDLSMKPHNGFKWLLAIVDCATKFLWLFPLYAKEAHLVAEALILTFDYFGPGPPKILHSDNGKEFKNKCIRLLQEHYRLRIAHGKPRKPQTQGAVERVNQTVGTKAFQKFEAYLNAHKKDFEWSNTLVLAAFCSEYNKTKHEAIGMTPYEAFYGRRFYGFNEVRLRYKDTASIMDIEYEEEQYFPETATTTVPSPTQLSLTSPEKTSLTGDKHPCSSTSTAEHSNNTSTSNNGDEHCFSVDSEDSSEEIIYPPPKPPSPTKNWKQLQELLIEESLKNLEKNRRRIMKAKGGKCEVFNINDQVMIRIPAVRGKLSKALRLKGKIVQVHREPASNEPLHLYDVEISNYEGRSGTASTIIKEKVSITNLYGMPAVSTTQFQQVGL